MVCYLVPPQIQHFSFGDEAVNAGDIVAVQCAVLKGDLPIEITWTHNGLPLLEESHVAITRSSARISALNIESVVGDHRGMFKCIAMNLAGRTELAAELMVNGTPGEWAAFCFFVDLCFLFKIPHFQTIIDYPTRNECAQFRHRSHLFRLVMNQPTRATVPASSVWSPRAMFRSVSGGHAILRFY